MRNTRKSGQILRSRKRPRPTGRSGRGSRTNSNTSHQIPARVIEADEASDFRLGGQSRPDASVARTAAFDPSETWAAPVFSHRKSIVRPSLKRGIIPPLHE